MNRPADLNLRSPDNARLLAASPDGGASEPVPVVAADAVSGFYFAGTPEETWVFARDFPDCTPPSSPFVELARPSRVVSGVHGLTGAAHLPTRRGWRFDAASGAELTQFFAEDRLDPDPVGAARRPGRADSGFFSAACVVRALDGLKAGMGRDDQGLGWLPNGDPVIGHDGLVAGPVAALDLILDGAGRPVAPPPIDPFGGGLTGAGAAVPGATILPLTFPAFMALSFLNTAGVKLPAVGPPPGVALRHLERGPPAPARYHPMGVGAAAGVDRNQVELSGKPVWSSPTPRR